MLALTFLNPLVKVTWFGMGESAAPSMADADAIVSKVSAGAAYMLLRFVSAKRDALSAARRACSFYVGAHTSRARSMHCCCGGGGFGRD
jgi:hypothetical protein